MSAGKKAESDADVEIAANIPECRGGIGPEIGDGYETKFGIRKDF